MSHPGGGPARGRRAPAANADRFLAVFLEEVAPSYDEWQGGLHQRLAERLVGFAAVRLGERCLDLGAGTGLVADLLSQQVGDAGSVVSTDVTERMLDVARQRLRATGTSANTTFAAMPIDDVVFRDDTFDLVTLGRSLGYLASPHSVLKEARRILKPDGRVAFFCRRRSLTTPAERIFFAALERLAADHPIRLPDSSPELSDLGERGALASLLTVVGLEPIRYSEMVTGGHAEDAASWNEVMVQTWPAARFLLGGLGAGPRAAFERELEVEMAALAEDAYRYHHPYLFAVAAKSAH